MKIALTFTLFLSLLLSQACYLRNTPISEGLGDLTSEMAKVSCENDVRADNVVELFRGLGGEPVVKEYNGTANIVVDLGVESDETVLVGAHYDKTTLGCGAIDNWTGVVLMSRLYRDLKRQKMKKNYLFVAFGDEEKGLRGSRAMATAIVAANTKKPRAMINLDSFGFDELWALKSISDRSLLTLAADVKRARGGSFSIRNYRGASSDSKSFRAIGVPSITFSGINGDWRDYLHKKDDQIKHVDIGKLAENLAFLRAFILKLDTVDLDLVETDQR